MRECDTSKLNLFIEQGTRANGTQNLVWVYLKKNDNTTKGVSGYITISEAEKKLRELQKVITAAKEEPIMLKGVPILQDILPSFRFPK